MACLYSCKKEDIKNNISHNNDLITRFIDLMLAYLLINDPFASKQYFIDKEYFRLADIIRNSFEYFVIAHEYSHWALGHLSSSTERATLHFKNESVDAMMFHWGMEFEADALAGVLTTETMRQERCDLFLGGLGIWVCFDTLEMIEKLQTLFAEENLNAFHFSKTHPPISARKSMFLRRYQNTEPSLFFSVDYIFESLWEYFQKFIKGLRNSVKKLKIETLDFYAIQEILYSIRFV